MSREVAISRRVRILVQTTANRHDLPRTVLLAPLLDQVNCVRKPADEGCVDHCGCPYLATVIPAAAVRPSAIPPQGRPEFLSAHKQNALAPRTGSDRSTQADIEPGIVLLIVWLGKNSDCVTDLINVYFGLSCGLNLDISRGPRSATSGPMQCSKATYSIPSSVRARRSAPWNPRALALVL